MEAIYLLLGWLLGLFTKRLEEAMQRPRTRRQLREAIFTELKELRGRMAVIAGQMAERAGKYDRALIGWSLPILEEYKGPYASGILATVREAANLSDERLKAASRLRQRPGIGLQLKKAEAPFLEGSIAQLSLFSVDFQRRALQIVGRLRIFNQEVEAAWFYFTKTFDAALPSELHQAILANAESAYQNVGRISHDTADMITDLLKLER